MVYGKLELLGYRLAKNKGAITSLKTGHVEFNVATEPRACMEAQIADVGVGRGSTGTFIVRTQQADEEHLLKRYTIITSLRNLL